MAAKSWNTDFRFAAIQASIRAFGDRYREDPFQYDGSFCIPVAEKPLVGWTPGRFTLIALLLGFVLLVAGLSLGTAADRFAPARMGPVFWSIAGGCVIAAILVFSMTFVFERKILCRLLGPRADRLIARAATALIMTAELTDANSSAKMKISIDGDDHVLIAFDEESHRLMIEGIGARYQIRAADVQDLAPFEFMNYLGVEITYRIDSDTSLSVAIARTSTTLEVFRQLHILYFFHKRIPNKLLERCTRTFATA